MWYRQQRLLLRVRRGLGRRWRTSHRRNQRIVRARRGAGGISRLADCGLHECKKFALSLASAEEGRRNNQERAGSTIVSGANDAASSIHRGEIPTSYRKEHRLRERTASPLPVYAVASCL